jgi:hypothetical protein
VFWSAYCLLFASLLCLSVHSQGVMGAGKGHTMEWLHREGLFPKEAFVNVDPDAIRYLLPEYEHYNQIDNSKTGFMTQKEVGYISEVSR